MTSVLNIRWRAGGAQRSSGMRGGYGALRRLVASSILPCGAGRICAALACVPFPDWPPGAAAARSALDYFLQHRIALFSLESKRTLCSS
jgi:hypothetical protein